MENWLNINQFRATEWHLNSNEEKLCAYYAKEHKWVTNKIQDHEGDFYCIAITKLIQELPTIGKAKPNFSRSLNSLAEKGIFDKQIKENNKKEVYYRFNPSYLKAWRDNSKKLVSYLENKKLAAILSIECYKNETSVTEINLSVTEMEQSVTEMEQSVTEMEPISINNQINNQINNNHNKDDDSIKAVTKMKQQDLKKEFDRILNLYPYTTNNTNEKIAQAFGVFITLNQAERMNVYKAVKNYANTENVLNQKTSKYILSIYTFLTKSYTKFIHGLPKNFTFAEKFEQKNLKVGAAVDSAITVYEQEDINKISDYAKKFEEIKLKLEEEKIKKIDDSYDDSWVNKMFDEKEMEIIFVKMGGLNNVINFPSTRLAESLVDLLKASDEQ